MSFLKTVFFEDGKHYLLIEKYFFLIGLFFIVYNIPINYVPKELLNPQVEISKPISEKLHQSFVDNEIHSITMTNVYNIFTGDCFARQTLTKNIVRKNEPIKHTYTYWVGYCSGDGSYLYDYKLMRDNGKLTLYTFGKKESLRETFKDDMLGFLLTVSQPIAYFSK